MFRSYYAILGVTFESTPDEIKKNYEEHLKQYHSDKNTSNLNASTEQDT